MAGLTEGQARERLEKFGENKITIKQANPFFSLLFRQYTNTVSLILFGAGLFSFYIREWTDFVFIFAVLIINGLFGFFQEYKAEKTLEKLKSFITARSRVIRDGREKEIDSKDLVPGDTVILQEGEKIAADGIFEGNSVMSVDESILTGEALPVEKNRGDLLFSGTLIFRGKGFLKVENTGFKTKLGEIAKGVSEIKEEKTPLALGLDSLGRRITLAAFALSIILILIGILQGREIKELVLTTVSVAVAAIPEGLPLIVSVALAVGAYRMAKERAIVRKMASIETLGAANLILTDKTGTITQNKMAVKKYFLGLGEKIDRLLLACSLGNASALVAKENGNTGFEILGDRTDGALALFVEENKGNYEKLKNIGKILFEKPFDSVTKTIEIVWRGEDGKFIFIKGAPEEVMSHLDSKNRKVAQDNLNLFVKEGLRTIAFAYKKTVKGVPLDSLKRSGSFNFLGIIGIYDPPRPEARETIQKAKSAGVRVVMVTGDNPETARYIAEDVGLIEKGELIVISSEIKQMTDEALLAVLPEVRIFARFTPTDKLRVVRLFKQKGYVVSVIGDGVNDALALKEANIGIAIGGDGTDVAREASDIVITDDNLLTAIKAIKEGRSIFNNILRSVFYLVSANMAEFAFIFLAITFSLPSPLLPSQILWINLITDGIPSLALVMDSGKKSLMLAKPRDIKENFLNKRRVIYVLQIAFVITVFIFLIFFFSLRFLNVYQARFLVFNFFVVLELITVFIVRGGIWPLNKFLIVSVLLSLFLQFLIIYMPFLRNFFF